MNENVRVIGDLLVKIVSQTYSEVTILTFNTITKELQYLKYDCYQKEWNYVSNLNGDDEDLAKIFRK